MIRKATVEGGRIVGIPAADPRITAFKGIPFAAPPVGENRWRAPQPVVPWEGERECFTFAPISMQHIPGLDKNNIYSREWNVDPEIPMSEDCLYLNVWTPAKTPDERLPVFVWFFGGGLKEGNTAEMEFDGERIARRGIVVVTVNYRLNVFGFLAHPELTASQPDAPSNFGHLDQRAGILWARKNIAAFGGDPDNITIGGQSAGGGSVCAQLTSPTTEGLFKKAVIFSGFAAGVYPNRIGGSGTFADVEERGRKFFEFLGVKTLAEARALDAVYIRDKCNEFPGMFGTSDDGVFQKGSSMQNMLNGRYHRMPLIMTHTATEFFNGVGAKSSEEFRELVKQYFGPRADRMLALCGFENGKTPDVADANAASRVSTWETALRAFALCRAEKGIEEPLYYGVFDPSIPGWDNPGSFHSSDLWFWFETLAKCWRAFKGYHFDLSRQMCNYLASFIRSGDPNCADNDGEPQPAWLPMTVDKPERMFFDDSGSACAEAAPSPVVALIAEATLEKNKF
ncbi:MAG: carboxylesterase family protein [Oscillospiraceae bacterium]|nr:carboxylesterase family protein [Oscillospiraceae bacterium]